jgi:hypothetical protein
MVSICCGGAGIDAGRRYYAHDARGSREGNPRDFPVNLFKALILKIK